MFFSAKTSFLLTTTHALAWNKELLYVGGFLSRTVYEFELSIIDTAWAGGADGSFRPPRELQKRLQEQFIHTLKFFAFHHSTPSPLIGTLIGQSFHDCSATSLRLLSSVGVREASHIKEHNPTFAKFLKDVPMLSKSVAHECRRTVQILQNQGMISPVTFPDILHSLRQHRLNKEELVSCLRWWISLGENGSAADLVQLLDAIVFSDADGSVLPLSSVQYFVDPETLGSHIPQDSPLPSSLFPQHVAMEFTAAELSTFGWREFTVVDWLQHISQPHIMSADPTRDFTTSPDWAARVLSALSHIWSSSSNDARCLVKEQYTSKTCVPTSCGLRTPGGSYLPGTSTDLFRDLELPVVQFPDDMKTTGELEVLLTFIGVRKHIDPQLIVNRWVCVISWSRLRLTLLRMTETGNWNIAGFIKYLVQVRKTLTTEEVTKLKSSAVFAKEGTLNDAARYRACDLYTPTGIFRQLQLPIIQWDEGCKWSDESDEGT